ncbi:phosphorylase [Westiellopsis prolifica IICB1]|nr:phosphorylase [Westiellopsis prolifica IICB1]
MQAAIEGSCSAHADKVPRIALISAFSGEADRLVSEMQLNNGANQFNGCTVINGHRFSKGKLRGKNVVVVLTNISVVNASMVTQLTLDKFRVTNVIFSGVAGGIGGIGANDDNPDTPNETPIGSVTIPQRWGFHQEMYFNNTRDTVPCAFSVGLQLNHTLQEASQEAQTCNFISGTAQSSGFANTETIFAPDAKNAFLRNTNVSSNDIPQYFLDANNVQQLRSVPFPGVAANSETDQDLKFWFTVDPHMLAKARQINVELLNCAIDTNGKCNNTQLDPAPRIIVGGNGISGPTFVDNAAYRKYVATNLNFDERGNKTNNTEVLVADMETTASAMVAFSNRVPFIAVRSVSDLAGGGDQSAAAQLQTFFAVAAENQARVVLKLVELL